MAHRTKRRKEEQYKRALGEIIDREARDRRFDFATVTEVELSEDLRHAKVYVDLPGETEEKEEAISKFNEDEGFFRSQIATKVDPRYTPEIEFFLDDRRDWVSRIDEIVSEEEDDQ